MQFDNLPQPSGFGGVTRGTHQADAKLEGDDTLVASESIGSGEPSFSDALSRSADWLSRREETEEAERHLLAVVRHNPEDGNAHYQLARTRLDRRDFSGALEAFELANRCANRKQLWLLELANAAFSAKRFDRALDAYTEALSADPHNASIVADRAVALHGLDRTDEAIAACHEAIRLDAGLLAPYVNLGLYLIKVLRLPEAGQVLRSALVRFPNNPFLLMHLASLANACGRADEALTTANRLLALHPQFAGGHVIRGLALVERGALDDAQMAFEQARSLDPTNSIAEWNLALLAALNGDLETGLRGLECRARVAGFHVPDRQLTGNAWDGSALDGKTVFVQFEQGLGDLLQFVRYARELKHRGASRVIVETPADAASVVRTASGVDDVTILGEAVPPHDVNVPLMSLAYRCETRLGTIPAEVPYLRASARPIATAIRQAPGQLKVGLVWGGNPHNSRDQYRSVPLAALLAVLPMDGVSLFSLQKGPHARALAPWRTLVDITDLDPHLQTLEDTAAVIMELDVVITVCTSIAHLAGALGQRTWTLLHQPADWRWFRDRDDSPWYPTMRLFRQDTPGDWARPLGLLRGALMDLHNSRVGTSQ